MEPTKLPDERDSLLAELRSVREVNAQLVHDLEQSRAISAKLLRELADALSRLETEKVTKGQ